MGPLFCHTNSKICWARPKHILLPRLRIKLARKVTRVSLSKLALLVNEGTQSFGAWARTLSEQGEQGHYIFSLYLKSRLSNPHHSDIPATECSSLSTYHIIPLHEIYIENKLNIILTNLYFKATPV